ncbi:hypothetical protein VitviT2T_003325 [Vitis vinifera]|uniref:Salicylate carboxymethyltransferase n=1 Tax=Vitis vinifera TaxID=29760 RepID=A0ABY9BL98_VITVI|nr:hypothetical protein VitviT2T_003325 [Vitis vinifera]
MTRDKYTRGEIVANTVRAAGEPILKSHFGKEIIDDPFARFTDKVPKELGTGQVMNEGNICIAKTSPPGVFKAYYEQFERDLTLFLESRAEEIAAGGGMLLTVMGSIQSNDPCSIWELVGITLNDMVLQGLIQEAKLDSSNLPYYAPTAEEVRKVMRGRRIIYSQETRKSLEKRSVMIFLLDLPRRSLIAWQERNAST